MADQIVVVAVVALLVAVLPRGCAGWRVQEETTVSPAFQQRWDCGDRQFEGQTTIEKPTTMCARQQSTIDQAQMCQTTIDRLIVRQKLAKVAHEIRLSDQKFHWH